MRLFGWIILMLVGGWGAAATADGIRLSTSARAVVLREQVRLLDKRAREQLSMPVPLERPQVYIPGTPSALAARSSYSGPWLDAARSAALRNDVPVALFVRLVEVESGWNPAARSPKGALGLAQLMPQTARRMRLDPFDPLQNLEGGARYLRRMYEEFGSWRLALAAYNAGPEAVRKWRGVPPFAETVAYVAAVLDR